jgi:hypothetical protein
MQKVFSLVFCLLCSQLFAQTIPANRVFDWYNAGHEGPIPDPSNVIDVTSFGAVGDSSTNNYTAIVNAINSLSGNAGVIYFPPGNYIIQSTVSLPDSVVIRGASSDSTHLVFDFGGVPGNSFNISGGGSFPAISVLSGYWRNSTFIVVADASGFSTGDYAEIFEENGSWDTQPASWANQSIGQIIRIDSVVSDTLFFHHPLRMSYDSLLSVRVQRFTPRREAGIECLSMMRRDSVASGLCIGVYMYHAVNCWIRGVESSRSIGSHFEADNSAHIEITGCYVHHSFAYDGASTHGYGITLFKHTCETKIENNIMQHLRHSFSLQCGANGNVFGYNYSIDPNRSEFPSNAGADISLHGHYAYANLFEGNIVQNAQIDQTWGPSGPYNTLFRNRIELYGLVMSSGSVQSDSQTFVGNEIPNMGPLMGMYTLAGTGHFEYGNNVRGVITPVGTTNLPDTSYYLSSQPSFWNISSGWPSIGEPNPPVSGSIPAKERFLSGMNLTQCSSGFTVGFGSNYFEAIKVYPNPGSSFTISGLNHFAGETIHVDVLNICGQSVFNKSYPATSNSLNLNLQHLSRGIYFLKISSGNIFSVQRIIKE